MDTMHILVPLDFSGHAEHTLHDAIAFAKRLQAQVTLLHVVDLPTVVHQGLNPYYKALHTTARELLENLAQHVRAAGLAVTALVDYGVPFQVILDSAKAQKVDLIIMGTHGRTGLQHVLLGSVTERVVRLASCPVLVTRLPVTTTPSESQETAALSSR